MDGLIIMIIVFIFLSRSLDFSGVIFPKVGQTDYPPNLPVETVPPGVETLHATSLQGGMCSKHFMMEY